ncbi:MAG TPA: hypothetical protein VJ650_02760 [Gemmatimonadaceae bacterium]|nr:hypothetical protein [Gemmatimonadaceae bacterium]
MSRKERGRDLALVALAGAMLSVATGCKDAEPERSANPTDTMFADFANRLDAYTTLRERLTDSIGDLDPTKSQAEIAARAVALGNAIIASRPEAKQGDIFSPEVAAFLATLIRQEYKRRAEPVLETREDQQEELPNFKPQVNQIYPTTYPLATFPPALLPVLPPLPEELEYRIVQDYLILRDVEANVIIDFMPGAVPVGG